MLSIVKEYKGRGWTAFSQTAGYTVSLKTTTFLIRCRRRRKAWLILCASLFCKSFMRTFAAFSNPWGHNPRHPMYGRFSPLAIWNIDQVPLSFTRAKRKSYNPKNTPSWVVNQGRSGLENAWQLSFSHFVLVESRLCPLNINIKHYSSGLATHGISFYQSLFCYAKLWFLQAAWLRSRENMRWDFKTFMIITLISLIDRPLREAYVADENFVFTIESWLDSCVGDTISTTRLTISSLRAPMLEIRLYGRGLRSLAYVRNPIGGSLLYIDPSV